MLGKEKLSKEDKKIQILKQKAESFFSNYVKVHVPYKKKGLIKNGYILELSPTFFFFNDDRDGKIMIFWQEILDILQFRKKRLEDTVLEGNY